MEVKAKVKNIRISPKKVRLVADLIRGKHVNFALQQLMFSPKKSSTPIEKLLKSAIANAEHNFNLDQEDLYVKEITVDEGMTLKRWMPRAFGRATTIRKRSSHINIVLGSKEEEKASEPKVQEKPSPASEKKVSDKKDAKKSEKKDEVEKNDEK